MTYWPTRPRLRLFLTLMVVAVLGCSAWLFASLQLPHPSEANRDQLLRWLVLRDMEQQQVEIRDALVRRIEDELLRGIDLGDGEQPISDRQIEQLNLNSIQLQSDWFHRRVRDYLHCPRDQRVEFLERQIQVVAAWSDLQSRIYRWWGETKLTAIEYQEKAVIDFFAQIDRWMAACQGGERANMEQVVQDSVICWLAEKKMESQSMAVRRALAERIASSLNETPAMAAPTTRLPLSLKQQETLVENAGLLFEAWFHSQAEKVAELKPANRNSYVDRQVEQVMKWDVWKMLGGEQHRLGGMSELRGQMATWIERAEEPQRTRLQALKSLVEQRVLARQIKNFRLPRIFAP